MPAAECLCFMNLLLQPFVAAMSQTIVLQDATDRSMMTFSVAHGHRPVHNKRVSKTLFVYPMDACAGTGFHSHICSKTDKQMVVFNSMDYLLAFCAPNPCKLDVQWLNLAGRIQIALFVSHFVRTAGRVRRFGFGKYSSLRWDRLYAGIQGRGCTTYQKKGFRVMVCLSIFNRDLFQLPEDMAFDLELWLYDYYDNIHHTKFTHQFRRGGGRYTSRHNSCDYNYGVYLVLDMEL